MYITGIYLIKQFKSSIIKNYKITNPLKLFFRLCARNKKKAMWEYPVTTDT